MCSSILLRFSRVSCLNLPSCLSPLYFSFPSLLRVTHVILLLSLPTLTTIHSFSDSIMARMTSNSKLKPKPKLVAPRMTKPLLHMKGSITEPEVIICGHTCSVLAECHLSLGVNVWAKAGNNCHQHASMVPHKSCTPACLIYQGEGQLHLLRLECPLRTSEWNALTPKLRDEVKLRYGAQMPPLTPWLESTLIAWANTNGNIDFNSKNDLISNPELTTQDGVQKEEEVQMLVCHHAPDELNNQGVSPRFSTSKIQC